MSLDKFEFAENIIARVNINQFAALNQGLRECGANARIGPPSYVGIARDPVATSEIGIYIHKDSHPTKDNKTRIVLRLDTAEEQLRHMYSKREA